MSKLPSLGIKINNELDLTFGNVVEITESECHVEFGGMDTIRRSHEGRIEITNRKVTVAISDGKSVL